MGAERCRASGVLGVDLAQREQHGRRDATDFVAVISESVDCIQWVIPRLMCVLRKKYAIHKVITIGRENRRDIPDSASNGHRTTISVIEVANAGNGISSDGGQRTQFDDGTDISDDAVRKRTDTNFRATN